MTSVPAEPIESPVWFAPLRSPSWLVPPIRDGAVRVAFCAEAWDEQAVGKAGRDLRLGLPLFLAEAARFGTDARPVTLRRPLGQTDRLPDATVVVRTAVAPGGRNAIRVRVSDLGGARVTHITRDANDEISLGRALDDLPRAVADAVTRGGVRPVWNSLYVLPAGAALAAYVRGSHACLRLSDEAEPADADAVAARRADERSVLGTLGSLATSTPEPFPALLFFGALMAARDAGSPVVGEFRMPANVRCTAATDVLDPVYAMTALVMRVFGDRDASDRRIERLRATGDAPLQRWLARVQAVT
ncbi:MAG TPA: hypothetical protein VG993_10535 [Actinomycetota bacterium]|nr:hypothetical protein [Actinomycetota bacterium]